jgi:hypothetical protein
MLEFRAKEAILEPRQSSGVRSFQDSQASEYGEHSKAVALSKAESPRFL